MRTARADTADDSLRRTAAPAEPDVLESRDFRAEAAAWFSRGVGFVGGGLLAYGLVQGFLAASSVFLLLFFAILLASTLDPIVSSLRSRLPVGRGGALLIVYAAFFATVLGIGLLFVPGAIRQAGDLAAALPAALQRARDASQGLQPEALRSSIGAIIDAATAALKPGPPPAAGEVVAQGLGVVGVVVSITTLLALVYFWMTERARLQRFALSFMPSHRRGGTREAWNDVELRLGLWVRGQLTLMAALTVMTGVAYTALGLPSALALALFAGIAEVIPIIGPAIGAVPAIAVTLTFRPDVLPLVILAYVVIQVIEGNVLVPVVMRNAIGVSPLLIILSLLVGAALGGFVGALVAVPVVAGLEAVLQRLQDRDVPVAQDATAAHLTADSVAEEEPPAGPGESGAASGASATTG